jgi:hypothetical protein
MSDLTAPVPASGLLETLDDSKVTRFQLKIMFISGMGMTMAAVSSSRRG